MLNSCSSLVYFKRSILVHIDVFASNFDDWRCRHEIITTMHSLSLENMYELDAIDYLIIGTG